MQRDDTEEEEVKKKRAKKPIVLDRARGGCNTTGPTVQCEGRPAWKQNSLGVSTMILRNFVLQKTNKELTMRTRQGTYCDGNLDCRLQTPANGYFMKKSIGMTIPHDADRSIGVFQLYWKDRSKETADPCFLDGNKLVCKPSDQSAQPFYIQSSNNNTCQI